MMFKDLNIDIKTLPRKYRGPYARWRKWKLIPIDKHFWARVHKSSEDECWPFMGYSMKFGHGVYEHGANHSGRCLAHRMAWKLTYGPIPEGLLVCHKCDNPICCNPHHLFVGTHKDNMQDCIKKGRKRPPTGERHPFAKLKEIQVIKIRSMCSTGIMSRSEIAKMFGVSKSAIQHIATGIKWKHLL